MKDEKASQDAFENTNSDVRFISEKKVNINYFSHFDWHIPSIIGYK